MAIASEEAVLLEVAAKAFAILIVDQEQTRTKINVEEVKRENIMLLAIHGYGRLGEARMIAFQGNIAVLRFDRIS
jgi:hypothetical protein